MNKSLLLAGIAAISLSLVACGEQESASSSGTEQPAPVTAEQTPDTKADTVEMADDTKVAAPDALTENTADGPDKAFILKAANSGMFEVESSRIAAERAQKPEVRAFAEKMVADHSKANADLKAVAGDQVPSEMDAATMAKIEEIRAASDETFDATYIDAQVAAHDEAVGLFSSFISSAENAELKAFAEQTLPTLEAHQEHVKSLQAE